MTKEDLEKLLAASKPVPLIALQCGMPSSPYDNVMAVWKELGERMGFKWDTVRPCLRESQLNFTADPF